MTLRPNSVLLLGEYRAERLVAPLRDAGVQVVVLGSRDVSAAVGPDVECGLLAKEMTPQDVVRTLAKYPAGVALPNPYPLGQEQLLRPYAAAAHLLSGTTADTKLICHPPNFVDLATDKVRFHTVATTRGWPVPSAMVCSDPSELDYAASALGLPVMVKEARTEPVTGRHFVSSGSRLSMVASAVRFPVLVQQALAGEEFGVELLSAPAGTAHWPVAQLGTLDERCAPGRRVRLAPAVLPPRAEARLATLVAEICADFTPIGPWQLDLAVCDDELLVLEINARLGGMSDLSAATTGLDPHASHALTALRQSPDVPPAARAALECPVRKGTVPPPPVPGLGWTLATGSDTDPSLYGCDYNRLLVWFPLDEPTLAADWLAGMAGDLLVGFDSIRKALAGIVFSTPGER